MGIFEVHNITSITMANHVKALMYSFGLFDKVNAYVKDKRSKLNTLIFTLTSVITCFLFN